VYLLKYTGEIRHYES